MCGLIIYIYIIYNNICKFILIFFYLIIMEILPINVFTQIIKFLNVSEIYSKLTLSKHLMYQIVLI